MRRARGRGAALALALALAILALPARPRAGTDAGGFRDASTPWRFEFPRDHAAHPAFRTEWWYYTGHLAAGARRFGYELTFFRVGIDRAERRSAWAMRDLVFAHAALTDETGRRFDFADTLARPALGRAGADSARYRVWLDGWSVGLAPDGRTHSLRADAGRFALELEAAPGKPPVIHGAEGISRKSADPAASSHYASLTRMPTRGRVRTGGRWLDVTGLSWMDHEFMSVPRMDQDGWDWFALQLDDGRELMLYHLRLAGGAIDPFSSGTLVEASGRARHLALSDFAIEVTGSWTSPASGARYPAGWRVRVPSARLDLVLAPTVADQELRTRGIAGVTYWEGSVAVTVAGAPAGRGYVELVGYARRADVPAGR